MYSKQSDGSNRVVIKTKTTLPKKDENNLKIDYYATNMADAPILLSVILDGSDNFEIITDRTSGCVEDYFGPKAGDHTTSSPAKASQPSQPQIIDIVNESPRPQPTLVEYSEAPTMKVQIGFSAQLNSMQTVHLGNVERIDESLTSALRVTYNWKYYHTNIENEEFAALNKKKIQVAIDCAEKAMFPAPSLDLKGNQVNRICQEKKIPFVDLEFPPRIFSLNHDGRAHDNELQAVEWKRPQEYMTGDIHVFNETISPSDIIQGSIKNCWYMCALASMTEYPHLVRELFLEGSRKFNPNGIYDLQFYKNGFPTIVRIDDLIPCEPGERNGPRYARCNGSELWVLLVEKGLAKLNGSYGALESGNSIEALMDLTGAPYKLFTVVDMSPQASVS